VNYSKVQEFKLIDPPQEKWALWSHTTDQALFMWEKNASTGVRIPLGTVWLCSDQNALLTLIGGKIKPGKRPISQLPAPQVPFYFALGNGCPICCSP